MSADEASYQIQANNDMFWTNRYIGPMYHTDKKMHPVLTMELLAKDDKHFVPARFSIVNFSNGTPAVYITSVDNQKYLQWTIWKDGPNGPEYASLTESKISSTTKWSQLTPDQKKQLTFHKIQIPNAEENSFRLQIPGQKLFFKRVYWTVEYVGGQSEVDNAGVFREIPS